MAKRSQFTNYTHLYKNKITKWPDKSTTSYIMLDFKSDIKNLQGKYLDIERHILQIHGIL